MRRATIATVIGLLAVTGMRIGEVIGLDDTDFDPDQAAAYRAACQARQAPAAAAASEHRRRGERLPRGCVIRPSRTRSAPRCWCRGAGTRLLHCNVGQTFAELARSAGLAPRSPRCRPRPHDLRHTFAVNTLLDWYRDGGDVAAQLPSLSTYLGHVAPANTYWYLQAAPELLTEAARRLEAHPADGGDRR